MLFIRSTWTSNFELLIHRLWKQSLDLKMGKRSLLRSFHRSKFDNLADWTNHLELARTKFSKNTIGSLIFILWNCCFGGIRLQIQTKEKNSYQFQSSIFAVKSMTVEFLQNSAQNYGQKSGRKISPLRLLNFSTK